MIESMLLFLLAVNLKNDTEQWKIPRLTGWVFTAGG